MLLKLKITLWWYRLYFAYRRRYWAIKLRNAQIELFRHVGWKAYRRLMREHERLMLVRRRK